MKKNKRPHSDSMKRGRLQIGDETEVEIERILPGGLGMAHAEGQTLLVALAAPGDRVRVRVREVRGSVAFASIEEIIAPSPVRIEPPCPYFGRCGGCDFQQLTYEAQLAAKVEIIRDCLRRIARIESPSEIQITPSPIVWHYRSRAQWQYDSRRYELGYFERGSHRVCDVVECPVIVPALQKTLTRLRGEVSIEPTLERLLEFQAVAGEEEDVTLSPQVWDQSTYESVRIVRGERYRFNADCFFQINHELLGPLVDEAIKDVRGESAVDLYCGVGLFTLPLARRFKRVVGVEGNVAACEYARRNLADAALENARIEASSVGEWLRENASGLAPVDFVLLDPPRAGAEGEAVKGILNLQPKHISYVSCDPATLARDLKELIKGGFKIDSLAAFDMFPQTHHVETVVRLSKVLSAEY